MRSVGSPYQHSSSSGSSGFGSVTTVHRAATAHVQRYDSLLTVFQAAPLVTQETSGSIRPVGELDFEYERQILKESVADARLPVQVDFEIATTQRFGNFLSKGKGRVLHFSCHGHPDYLAIENGWGAMHPLPVQDLKDWIQAGNNYLRFVFVSACHSRKAGEAFLEAGVKHVVCCQQEKIRNIASVEFSRAFYQALANGRVLREAFELAREEVKNCPYLSREERRLEGSKFALLPEDGDHDVAIFDSTSNVPPYISASQQEKHDVVPLPPHIFEGRQIEMFRVLDALKSARVVRVTGPQGVGKCSVVSGVCRYIQERKSVFQREFSRILWIPSNHSSGDDPLSETVRFLSRAISSNDETLFEKYCQQMVDLLYDKRVLVVLDARQNHHCTSKIASFMEDFIRRTTYTKSIVIHHVGDAGVIRKLPCQERDVILEPLHYDITVRLFARLCQHVVDRQYAGVSNAVELCNLLIPDNCPTERLHTRRGRDIYNLLGEGNPTIIAQAAKSMTEKQYQHLISLGQRKEFTLQFKTRTALEYRLSKLAIELQEAVDSAQFVDAHHIQEQYQETEILRETLSEMKTLKALVRSVKTDQALAVQAHDFLVAAQLQEELDALQAKIGLELAAMEHLGIVEDSDECEKKLSASDSNEGETRAILESKVKTLKSELDAACERNDFKMCRAIHSQIEEVSEHLKTFPSREQLLAEVYELKMSLKKAKVDRNWDLCEGIHVKLVAAEENLEKESDSQEMANELAGEKVPPDPNRSAAPGATAVAGLSGRSARARDPSGTHVAERSSLVSARRPLLKPVMRLPVAMPVSSKDTSTRSQSMPSESTEKEESILHCDNLSPDQESIFGEISAPIGMRELHSSMQQALGYAATDQESYLHSSTQRAEGFAETNQESHQESVAVEECGDLLDILEGGNIAMTTSPLVYTEHPVASVQEGNRLLLEQMIQESISNMAVPAIKVENISNSKNNKTRKKSGGVRTFFGMKKR